MKTDAKRMSGYNKYNNRIADSEKKHLKKIFGNSLRDIVCVPGNSGKPSRRTECVDLILTYNGSDIDDVATTLKNCGYFLTVEDFVFTAKKYGKIFTLYMVKAFSEKQFVFNNFVEYIAVNTQREREYTNLKNRSADICADLRDYELSKLNFIKKISFEAFCWKSLGKKISVSDINSEDKSYDINNTEYLLNTGLSDRSINGQNITTHIMGVKKSVYKFSGKIIAVIKDKNGNVSFVASPVNKIYYSPDILKALRDNIDIENSEIVCLYEKSCGAVVYKREQNKLLYLLIKNRSKNIGFPKGHVEKDETEIQTASREIKEETNVSVRIDESFRISYNYSINFFIKKQAVYFIAEITDGEIKIPEDEILSYHFVPYNEAVSLLTYPNEKKILKNANQYIKNK